MTGILGLAVLSTTASDWPQYRGPNHDGISTDRLLSQWNTNAPGFVVWRNASLTNGFSSFAVSQGRAFTLISRDIGGLKEVCVAVDAATGTDLWGTRIDDAVYPNGGAGSDDGPRSTPSVADGRVFAFSAHLHLVCLNATNGSVIWSNDLVSAYGASEIPWQNAASPRVEGALILVNLNTATNNQTLAAFRTTDGSLVWSTQNENMTHSTPVVATIAGVRQVIFATKTGLVSLNCTNGAFLWKYVYPFYPIDTCMGSSPLVSSNIVFCSASYGRGTAAARISYLGGVWTPTQLYYKTGFNYRDIWMSPVCSGGYVYTLCGDNSTFLTPPLNCIELNTGNLMWATNNFGMGGTLLVDGKVLTLTEDGQLVLSQPNPSAYTELARFRAFDFSTSPGKCWNSPAVADGRIYARSTRGGICVDVSVAPLRMLAPQFTAGNRLQLLIGTANGSAVDSNRLAKLEVRYTTNLATSLPTWARLTNTLVLTNGVVRVDNVDSGTARYFIASEQP